MDILDSVGSACMSEATNKGLWSLNLATAYICSINACPSTINLDVMCLSAEEAD